MKSRLEDLARKKNNISKWKFETPAEDKEDKLWIESCKKIINEEVKIIKDNSLTSHEKKVKGWELAWKEMEWWDVRKPGLGGGLQK